MLTSEMAGMLTSADVKRYRESIGLTQIEFAKRIGVSQSALSLMESGRIAVSDRHVERLREQFLGRGHEQPFTEFLSAVEAERKASGPALTALIGRYLTLTVWRWEDGFDLSRPPAPDQAVSVVTIQSTDRQAIAFQMSRESKYWAGHELLVLAECRPTEVKDRDVCLIQFKPPRTRALKTVLAIAHVASPRGSSPQLTPIAPRCPTLWANDEAIRVLMRTVFRGRRL